MNAVAARLTPVWHGLVAVPFQSVWAMLGALFVDSCPSKAPGCTGSECHDCVWDKAIK